MADIDDDAEIAKYRDWIIAGGVGETGVMLMRALDRRADEIEALRVALVNAKYALEFWERESKVWSDTRVPGARPGWMDRTRKRGKQEIRRADAALTQTKDTTDDA